MMLTRLRSTLIAALALASLPAALTAQADSAITVFLVRHAEKGSGGSDPSLTAEGAARAKDLARTLRDARISAIFVSQFKRTQETAVPLAHEIHRNPVVANAAKTDDLVATLRALPAGTRALVVSHSNLMPGIVERLTGKKIGELTDRDYDGLYVLSLTPAGGSVLYLHYGAPSGSR